MKEIPDLIFFMTGNTASNAFLSVMKEMDLIPERIVYLNYIKNSHKDTFKGRILKKHDKRRILNFIWERFPFKKQASKKLFNYPIYESIKKAIITYYSDNNYNTEFFSISRIEELSRSDIPIETLSISSINDSNMVTLIKSAPQHYALNVQGQLIKDDLLKSGVRFLHIHPGLLPEVRGISTLLWGAQVHDKIGGTLFEIDAGIDSGDIIHLEEYPVPKIPIPKEYLISDYAQERFLALETVIDPLLRADVLCSALKRSIDISQLEKKPQNHERAVHYFYPHQLLRDKMVLKFFTEPE